MHPLKGRKQSPEHISKRLAAMPKTRKPGGGRPANTAEVIWSKVKKGDSNECWPWIGWRNEQGYGRTEIKDVAYYAHRVIFDLVHPQKITLAAPKDGSQTIMHICDNPPCCNPAHLRLGTHQENIQDMMEKGRKSKPISHQSINAKLTEDEVREIRFMKRFATCKALALLYDVSATTIHGLLYGRHYQDIV